MSSTSNTSATSYAGVPSIKVDERERERKREKERPGERDKETSSDKRDKDSSTRIDRAGDTSGGRAGRGGRRVAGGKQIEAGGGEFPQKTKAGDGAAVDGPKEATAKSLHRRPSGGESGGDGLVGIGALLKPNTKGMFKVTHCNTLQCTAIHCDMLKR